MRSRESAWSCSARSNAFPLNADSSNKRCGAKERCAKTPVVQSRTIVRGTICSSDVETLANVHLRTWPTLKLGQVSKNDIAKWVKSVRR